MAISTAISNDRVSRVVGYKVKSGNFGPNTPYLPQRIAILGEGNTANQADFAEEAFEFITAKQVGDKYGYGSPLHQIARILRPVSGDILGGIPTVIYPQKEAAGATATIKTFSATGTAAAGETHSIIIGGRKGIDGLSYDFTLAAGDTGATLLNKIVDAVNSVLGSPVIAAVDTGNLKLTTKWKGATSAGLTVYFETYNNAAGITYASVATTAGTTTPTSIASSLALFGETWNTLVLNQYGTGQFSTFETFNGVPDADNPTGRYVGNVFKPFVAFTGYVGDVAATLAAITNAADRLTQVTNVIAPAPNSAGFEWEAAANMIAVYAPTAQNLPHLGAGGRAYPDMPTPTNGDAGDFGDYNQRDYLVKKGASTVTIENGKYTIQDMVTTYHPDGETPPKFRYARDLVVDWNIAFGWILIQKRDIQDKTLVSDSDVVNVDDTISPKQGKQLLVSYIIEKSRQALLADADFSVDSIQIGVNQSNPARLDFYFKYKRTSTANIVSADAEVDFAFSL